MLSPTLEITKGAVRSLKTVCKELRKTGRVFQKHRQEPHLSLTSEDYGHYLSPSSGYPLDRFYLSPTLYPGTQVHPKASKHLKTKQIFNAAAATSGATI